MPAPTLNIVGASEATVPKREDRAVRESLSQDLRDWWSDERADWDAQVERNGIEAVPDAHDSDLWDAMPVVDSKTVARTSPIFEKHLGRPLDTRLIRPGGYKSIDHMIRHLVPLMMNAPHARSGVRAVMQEVES